MSCLRNFQRQHPLDQTCSEIYSQLFRQFQSFVVFNASESHNYPLGQKEGAPVFL